MEVIKSLDEMNFNNLVLSIGNFDGIHLGHQKLFKKKKKDKLLIITFKPHPQIFFNNFKNFLITEYDERKKLFENFGVDYLMELNFDKELSNLSPEKFLENHVLKIKSLKKIILGKDFKFGKNGKGNFSFVQNFCKNKEIEIIYVEKFLNISSTMIREKILKGEVHEIKKLLGRYFSIKAKVVHGSGRGIKIGFLTANLEKLENKIYPKKGVYITLTNFEGKNYASVTNIGTAPTFEDKREFSVENHILDFEENIYSKSLEIKFIQKIREEKKFNTIQDLSNQIRKDILIVRKFFKNLK